ncbi:MAG: efflux RND transporter periplasmic adaptor subunit [Burkholderiales bacterium]
MKLMKTWGLVLLIVVVLAGLVGRALQQRQSARTQAQQTMRAGTEAPALVLGESDVWRLAPVEFGRTVPVSGGLKAFQSATIKAKVASEVKALTVREGDSVQAGQVVGQLDTTEFDWRVRQAEQTAAASRAQWDVTQRTLANNRSLVAQGFISPTALETSLANDNAAKANYDAAQAAVALARKALADTRLLAPIAGQVSLRLAQVGERVGVDARILEIVDIRRLELEAALAPEDVALVRVGQNARLQIDGLEAPVAATVARINPSAQSGSRSVLVYLSLTPTSAATAVLRQGLFARGSIELERRKALVLPVSALRLDQDQPLVQILVDGQVQHRTVAVTERGDAVVDGQPQAVVLVTPELPTSTVVLRGLVGNLRSGTKVNFAPTGAAPSKTTNAP